MCLLIRLVRGSWYLPLLSLAPAVGLAASCRLFGRVFDLPLAANPERDATLLCVMFACGAVLFRAGEVESKVKAS